MERFLKKPQKKNVSSQSMSRPGFTPRVRFSFHVDVYSNVCKEADLLTSGPPARVNGLTFGFALTAALTWRDLTGQRARSTPSGSHATAVVAPFQVDRSTLIPSFLHLSKRSWCVCCVGDVVSWVTPPAPTVWYSCCDYNQSVSP